MLEVREVLLACESDILIQICLPFLANFLPFLQVELHIAMLSLVLVLDLST